MEHHYSTAEERKNRFASSGTDTPRSASQPPTTNGDGFYSSPAMQIYGSPRDMNGGNGAMSSPWGISAGRVAPLPRSSSIGISPSSLPRSASFSASAERAAYGGSFASAIRESHSFPLTFEDDESEALSDTTGDYVYPTPGAGVQIRGRNYLGAPDTRSRSQSLATATATRPLPIGSPPASGGVGTGWAVGPLSIPGRYADIKSALGYGSGGLGSRYSSLGGFSRSPAPSPTSLQVSGGRAELTNISPLARDVGQILLDEESWMVNGGDSGTTSRRHSISAMQPRRGIIGFNAPDNHDEARYPFFTGNNGGNGGANAGMSGGNGDLAISDDELAVSLGDMLNLNSSAQSRSSVPPSQPSSLPNYAPLSRNFHETSSAIAESLSIPPGEHFARRLPRSPSEGASAYSVSSGAGSPDRSPALDSYAQRQVPQQAQGQRYIHGHGISYDIPEDAPAPTSPTYVRSAAGPNASFMQMQAHAQLPLSPTRQMQVQQLLHQQQLANAPALQRRPSQSEVIGSAPQSTLSDLGRGVPLHAVPGSWQLYIVEFKAGRTDLFYVAELGIPPLRVGDLVIVEADRGKDLGKVVNDTITAREVEAFQRQQAVAQQAMAYNEQGGGYGGPQSPDGPGPSPGAHGKREINPKKIYGKATAQDAQQLVTKHQDEAKALALCQQKIKQKKLPMEVIDAEYQWDRRKLTFYFVAKNRIDFRELVRELFRLYKTRIWMASLQGTAAPE